MKNLAFILLIVSVFYSCDYSPEQNANSKPQTIKKWLGHNLEFNHVVNRLDSYDMIDSTGSKIGSMIFGTSFYNGKLIVRDTSQFDDGSVYETADFVIDTANLFTEKFSTNMTVGSAQLLFNLKSDSGKLIGDYKVIRNGNETITTKDTVLSYDIARIELYTLLHALDISNIDSISFNTFVSTSFSVSKTTLKVVGEEEISVPYGEFNCTKLELRADGRMPDNDIWITNTEPRRIVKFLVPQMQLSIELVTSEVK